MSLDGYIADEEGSYDWIVPVPNPALDTAHRLPFEEFLAEVDIVVMGRRCYDQDQHRDYVALGKRVVVATAKPPARLPGEDLVEFVGNGVIDLILAERNGGRRCFLFGGGVLVQSSLAADAVDEMTIGVVPVVLGGGRPLFGAVTRVWNWHFTTMRSSTARCDWSTDADNLRPYGEPQPPHPLARYRHRCGSR